MTVDPSETRTVAAKITVSEKTSDFSGSIRLFTVDPRSPEIDLAYAVRVVPSRTSGSRQAE